MALLYHVMNLFFKSFILKYMLDILKHLFYTLTIKRNTETETEDIEYGRIFKNADIDSGTEGTEFIGGSLSIFIIN